MKQFKLIFFIFFLILSSQSCSFKWTRIINSKGEKYWTRQYKDNEKNEQLEDRTLFKQSKKNTIYQIYTGNIHTDTTHFTTFIQFDSVRVYLFNGTDLYKKVFTSGLISGQMIYCKLNSSCQPTPSIHILDALTKEPIVENLWGWTGHTITIDYFQEIKYIKSKPTKRKFKFWVYTYKKRFNGGNAIFLLELTNKMADKHTNLEEFIEGAEVTFLTHARSMI